MNRDLEAELVERARRGDDSAAPFLVSCFGERLLGYARAHAPDLSDADREQIVELAIEAGVRAIDRFDPSKGTLAGWFRGQVRFKTLGWRRGNPPLGELREEVDHPSPPISSPTATVDVLRAAMRQLSDDDQLVLALRSAEQITFAEIADRLHITEATARQRHHRALERLRAALPAQPERLSKGVKE